MADIIRPELIWIEGRCYRVNDPTTDVASLQEHDMYGNDNEMVFGDNEDDDLDEEFEVVQINETKYSTSLHVPQHYLGSVIGRMGATKKRIERDTWTEIKIPKQGQSGDVLILGPGASNVKAARRKINMIVLSSRMKQKPTHFISIPVVSPEIIENFTTFKESVLGACGACGACGAAACDACGGVEESLFVSPARLHVTLAVLTLMDEHERAAAARLLLDARENIIMPLLRVRGEGGALRLRLRLRGVACMSDEPDAAHVLYARVLEHDVEERAATAGAPGGGGGGGGVLQALADRVREHFYRAGFERSESASVTLHVTLMNSRHRAAPAPAPEPSAAAPAGAAGQRRRGFSAARVLRDYSGFEFGAADATALHISNMHDSSDKQRYYTSSCELPLLGPQPA